jgi:hypothetical protein
VVYDDTSLDPDQGDMVVERSWTDRRDVFPVAGLFRVVLRVRDNHDVWGAVTLERSPGSVDGTTWQGGLTVPAGTAPGPQSIVVTAWRLAEEATHAPILTVIEDPRKGLVFTLTD